MESGGAGGAAGRDPAGPVHVGGRAGRAGARKPHAMETSEEFNRTHADGYHITMPYVADEKLVQKVVKE